MAKLNALTSEEQQELLTRVRRMESREVKMCLQLGLDSTGKRITTMPSSFDEMLEKQFEATFRNVSFSKNEDGTYIHLGVENLWIGYKEGWKARDNRRGL